MAAALIFGVLFLLGRGKESTDDAQVEGRVVSVSARVAGIPVAKVLVQDNQQVKAGDLLVELDKRDLEARLAGAKADVLAARASLASAATQLTLTKANTQAMLRQAKGGLAQAARSVNVNQAAIDQARADQTAAESAEKLASLELERGKQLIAQKVIPQADLDARQAKADQARANVQQARAHVASTEANVGVSTGGVEVASGRLNAALTAPAQVASAQASVDAASARVQQFEAALQLAELNYSYAEIRAPIAGVVSRRSVEQGQLVSPERPLMALVPLDDVWIVANFKEDQIGGMKAGQKARVRVDTFGRREFDGHVDSLASGSGARFALLPPDNASGNFVKVVQRVPVLIRLDGVAGSSRSPDVQLRPGMSADVTVLVKD